MEHSEYLGETLREIAFEKASIHRPGVPMIALQHSDAEVREVIEEIAGSDLSWWISQVETSWNNYTAMVREAATILGWSTNSTQCVWPGRSPDSVAIGLRASQLELVLLTMQRAWQPTFPR